MNQIHFSWLLINKWSSYRPRNLLLTSLFPGPHDLTCDEYQRAMAATVADLLMLYDHGISVRTPKYPDGTVFAQDHLLALIDSQDAVFVLS